MDETTTAAEATPRSGVIREDTTPATEKTAGAPRRTAVQEPAASQVTVEAEETGRRGTTEAHSGTRGARPRSEVH